MYKNVLVCNCLLRFVINERDWLNVKVWVMRWLQFVGNKDVYKLQWMYCVENNKSGTCIFYKCHFEKKKSQLLFTVTRVLD